MEMNYNFKDEFLRGLFLISLYDFTDVTELVDHELLLLLTRW